MACSIRLLGWGLEERSLSHKFQRRNFGSMRVCDQCNAVKPFAKTPRDLLKYVYTDFRLSAPWASTIRGHQQYMEETPAREVTPWVEVPGFVITRVRWDTGHTILLGTGKDLAASFLYDLAPCPINCLFDIFWEVSS